MSWKECPGKRWHAPLDIYFCRHQIVWLLESLYTLENEGWPPHPDGKAKIDWHGLVGGNAYFTVPAEFAAEISWRLKQTGSDGEWLLREIEDNKQYEDYYYRAKDALNYMSGWRRKAVGYSSWKATRTYRKKNNRTRS